MVDGMTKEDLEKKSNKEGKKGFVEKVSDLQKQIKAEAAAKKFTTKFHGSTVGDVMPAE